MNYIERAFYAGKEAAVQTFKPVSAPSPKPIAPKASETATTPGTAYGGGSLAATGKPSVKAPAAPGLPTSSLAGMQGTIPVAGGSVARNTSLLNGPGAPALAQNTFATAQNAVLGPLAKLSAYGIEMHHTPRDPPSATPLPDNGRAVHRLADNAHQDKLEAVRAAWASQRISRPHDVLNEAGQMEFGAPRG